MIWASLALSIGATLALSFVFFRAAWKAQNGD